MKLIGGCLDGIFSNGANGLPLEGGIHKLGIVCKHLSYNYNHFINRVQYIVAFHLTFFLYIHISLVG